MYKAIFFVCCLCALVAMVSGHAALGYPVPWLNQPATSKNCPGTKPDPAASTPFTLYAGQASAIPTSAGADMQLVYKNSMIWKVVAGDGAGAISLKIAKVDVDTAAVPDMTATAADVKPVTITNGPAGTTDGADPSKVGPYNVTWELPANLATDYAGKLVAVRIGTTSWAGCFTATIKAMPSAPTPPPPKSGPAPAPTDGKGSVSSSVTATTAEPLEGCSVVQLPSTAFCYGAWGASKTGLTEGMKMFPYQIDSTSVPQLAGTQDDVNAYDEEVRKTYDGDMKGADGKGSVTFSGKPLSNPQCVASFKRYLCAKMFPVCRAPTTTGPVCNTACKNVVDSCQPAGDHEGWFDCDANYNLKAPKWDSVSLCSAVKPLGSVTGNSASSVAVSPLAIVLALVAILFAAW